MAKATEMTALASVTPKGMSSVGAVPSAADAAATPVGDTPTSTSAPRVLANKSGDSGVTLLSTTTTTVTNMRAHT